MNEGEHAQMLAWYRESDPIFARHSSSLNNGEPGHTCVTYSEEERWLSMERGDVTVICNLGETERLFPIQEGRQVVLGSRGAPAVINGVVTLPANTVLDHR